jgi:hypothetical protein
MKFTNGFTSWQETHFEIVEFITTQRQSDKLSGKIKEIHELQGTGGFYELAEDWTNEFELKYKDVMWGEELEFFETMEEFLNEKNNQ